MFGMWHWAGIQGALRNYYRLNHSSDVASRVIGQCSGVLAAHGLEASAKRYAVDLTKWLRSMGCDKASAYVAGACAYVSHAFQLNPERCKIVTPFVQDSFDNSDMLHPLAVAALVKAKEEMLDALGEITQRSSAQQERSAPISQKRSLLKDRRRAREGVASD